MSVSLSDGLVGRVVIIMLGNGSVCGGGQFLSFTLELSDIIPS